ncbi:MFS transporter [Erythrobacter sp. R86502]|uniref:POT-type proton-dependent oligopeptide transporter n=1 Tax=Erythrobacter sp. R86502 TaxID=3093846 RepID=UPI0036D3D782
MRAGDTAPLIGGIIADRLIGPHRAILLGGLMMAAGHGLLVVEAVIIPALTLIALGSGFFKGSAAARLSGLYGAGDPRRVEGFRMFYLAINIAGLIAPLVIGTVGERVHWHAGFALSCAAMVSGLAIYAYGYHASAVEASSAGSEASSTHTRQTRIAPIALIGLEIATALLTVPNAQLTNAYLLWAKEGFERDVAGWRIPVSWLIAADGLVSLAALVASGMFWAWHDRHRGAAAAETKALAGAGFVVVGGACLTLAALVHGRTGVPIMWGLAFQLLNSLGLANVLPAVMASFGQASPHRLGATVMAGFYLSLFAGGLISTWLASQFVTLPITTFWLLHALCGVAGALIIALLKWYAAVRHPQAPGRLG